MLGLLSLYRGDPNGYLQSLAAFTAILATRHIQSADFCDNTVRNWLT
jgi:hypothetical protein